MVFVQVQQLEQVAIAQLKVPVQDLSFLFETIMAFYYLHLKKVPFDS
jgi:hypothetical protein